MYRDIIFRGTEIPTSANKERVVPLPLDNQLCFTLYATSMAINRTYKPMLDEMGITYPQYLVLNALGEADGMSVGRVAHRLALESSTVTPLVKRMEQAGLVTRQRSQTDERQVQVDLTRHLKAQATVSTGTNATATKGNAAQDNGSSAGLSYEFEY